ncbi:MAG: zf-HC2 domain-containing protein [Deltaproteobacteria bacterium]|nr:zf-HC2 domain-containing protein [Deltaproteobacteria bacterium]
MECERIQDLLSDYLDGSISESGHADVSAHLRKCRICAETAGGLESTIRMLKAMPSMKAPPELAERIRRETERPAPSKSLLKKLFFPAHVKIPIEAAAAILIFLLVYGIQRTEQSSPPTPAPAARMEAAAPSTEEGKHEAGRTEEKTAGGASSTVDRTRQPRDARATGRLAASAPASTAPQPPPARPVVPAQRVSTLAERIEPVAPPEENMGARKEAPVRMLAAPPSRLMLPVPHGREVTLEVAAAELTGLEERIVEAAVRRGGSRVHEPAAMSAETRGKTAGPEAVRVRLPADSTEHFLSDLRNMGTIPAGGAPAWADIPAGPAPGTVHYTVRIRVR